MLWWPPAETGVELRLSQMLHLEDAEAEQRQADVGSNRLGGKPAVEVPSARVGVPH